MNAAALSPRRGGLRPAGRVLPGLAIGIPTGIELCGPAWSKHSAQHLLSHLDGSGGQYAEMDLFTWCFFVQRHFR